jgi:prophage antirepressor-like protein
MNSLALTLDYSGQRVRMVGTSDRPEWVAADVCAVLGIEQHHRALAGMPDDCKGRQILTTLGGPQELLTVTEPGLYRLVARSRKPEAEPFQRFVFHDVLPSIRAHGQYPAPGAMTLIDKRQQIATSRAEMRSVVVDVVGEMVIPRLEAIERHLERVPTQRKEIPDPTKRAALSVIRARYGGRCPCCLRAPILADGDPLPNLRWDHWSSRGLVGASDVWPVCEPCNIDMGEAGSIRRAKYAHLFETFQAHRSVEFGDGSPKALAVRGQRAFVWKL